jgi:hypothetical protein
MHEVMYPGAARTNQEIPAVERYRSAERSCRPDSHLIMRILLIVMFIMAMNQEKRKRKQGNGY